MFYIISIAVRIVGKMKKGKWCKCIAEEGSTNPQRVRESFSERDKYNISSESVFRISLNYHY